MKGRKLLMIPGPVEFSPEVLSALGQPTTSHVSPDFMECFGQCLQMMRQVFLAPSSQPFIVAGTGTLAMDLAASNLVEPGDRALVINTGYFGDRMGDMLCRYGAEVDYLDSPVGEVACAERLREALKDKDYALVAMTHVDTSTGVLTDVKNLSAVAKDAGCLTIVDGVCGTAGAECRSDEWGVDVHLTASQKAIGVPPGLALVTVSEDALRKFESRATPVPNYYADINNWLPIMQAYEARKGAYFGTPAVNLVYALNASLREILDEGMEARFARHRRLAQAFRAGASAIGLKMVPKTEELAAPTLSALYYPEGIDASLTGHINASGVIVAGGLHPKISDQYFRVGHMGVCNESDILATVGAIERALATMDDAFTAGAGVTAAQKALSTSG